MASATISFNSVCGGGGHLVIDVQVGAGPVRTFHYTDEELRRAITVDEIREAALTIMRFHCGGLTRAQAKAELDAGIQVTTA